MSETVISERQDNKMEDESNANKVINNLKWLVIIAIIAIVFVFTVYFLNFNNGFSDDQGVWGTFGDFMGGTLNPILSFLSLIALLSTIVLQQKELGLSRTELKYTRDELERSANAQVATQTILDEQSDTMARQQFESTFFSLIDQHNKVLENFTKSSTGKFSSLGKLRNTVFGTSSDLEEAKYIIESNNLYGDQYFSVLYQLLKFIATNSPETPIGTTFKSEDIENKTVANKEMMYSNMVRSFLDFEITQLLAVNCYCNSPDDINWNYKLLIERYAFLENMPFKYKGNTNGLLFELYSFYKPPAFGKNIFIKDTFNI